MNSEPLMDALVQVVLFLERSDPESVDEDAAIGMMEQIASTLQNLGPADKNQFLGYLESRASRAKSEDERRSLEEFASDLGLTAE